MSGPHVPIIKGNGQFIRGERVAINDYCHFSIQSDCVLEIGDDTIIGPFVMINTGNHGLLKHEAIATQPHDKASIHIGQDCWIGGHVSILRGVVIPEGCVIGAGSVVTRSRAEGMSPYQIWAGNPVKLIGMRE